jgi:Tol biopolymer transport system component
LTGSCRAVFAAAAAFGAVFISTSFAGAASVAAGRIAFSHTTHDDIFTLEVAGHAAAQVTRLPGGQFDPSWSPDRRRLAFRDSRAGINRNDEIYVVDADGSNLRDLTNNSANDWSPAWSPDGKLIAFASERQRSLSIWVMQADGTAARKLTNGGDEYPAWSPDSRSIAFSRGAPVSDIWKVSRDGSHLKQLTRSFDPEWLPTWSRRGQIAYVRGFEGHGELWVMNGDGTNQRRLTRGHNDMAPSWSRNARRLVFSRDGVLTLMNADGSGIISLHVAGILPDWS